MDYLAYTPLAIIAVGLAVFYLQYWRRTHAMSALAKRVGFHYLGKAVPKSLTLDGTEVAGLNSMWHVIDGEHGGVRLIVFDCRIGMGKGSRRRTVLAAETADDRVFPTSTAARDFAIERSGRWVILYQTLYQAETVSLIPPGLMPTEEIEAYVNAVSVRPDSSAERTA